MSTAPALTAPVSSTDPSLANALASALFEPDDFDTVHAPWQQLIAQPAFTYQCNLSEEQRTELSYRRLALINERLDHPLALASDPIRLAGIHEWIGPADPTCTSLISIHHNLYLGSLAEADQHPERTLHDSATTGVFLATECLCGNDAATLRTTATWNPDDQTFELNTPEPGAQKYMPNSSPIGGRKSGVVAARLIIGTVDHGIMLFHVPLTTAEGKPLEGIRIRQLPERAGAPLDHCVTSFDNVKLPAHALLEGDHGRLHNHNGAFTSNVAKPRAQFLAAISRVTAGKLAMSASAIGVARAALAIAVRYSHHRYITGRPDPVPIAAHRTHSSRLTTHLASAYAMTFLHRQTLHAYATGDDRDGDHIERTIALTKAFTTWHARDIVTEARERCGAHGLFPFNGIAGLAAALDGAITAEGDNLPILVKAAAERLFDQEPLIDAPPLEAWDASTATLSELRHLLAVAESIVARRARARFRADTESHPHGLARWNEASLPAVEAATLHTAGLAAVAFIAAAEACPDRQARHLLAELARLFLLQQIQPYTGLLMANGYLLPEAVRALPDAIESHIVALADHQLTLVDAFRLNGYLATIPLANADYQQIYAGPNGPTGSGESANARSSSWERDGQAPEHAPHPRRTKAHRPHAA